MKDALSGQLASVSIRITGIPAALALSNVGFNWSELLGAITRTLAFLVIWSSTMRICPSIFCSLSGPIKVTLASLSAAAASVAPEPTIFQYVLVSVFTMTGMLYGGPDL